MRRLFLTSILLCIIFSNAIGKKNAPPNRPKLVVGVVIDQMRWDYLYRYSSSYGSRGFKRLMRDGFNCQNTMINYLPSFTAPGHTCVYTGSVPAIHGIAANDWFDNFSGKPDRKVYCTEDNSVELVSEGSTLKKPMSPKNLLVSTITDELRLATNFKSRVFGVALKDRGSILPAGHLANGAYWLDQSTGNFCSSTYYKKPSPDWLKTFNGRHVADSLIALDWTLLDPSKKIYTQSLADNNKYEGSLKGETAPVFPHSIKTLKGSELYETFERYPAGNTLTLQIAKACRDGERLGEGDATDFLCVSLSSTDYAGHQFSPNSLEVEDMYIKLDKELGDFLDYLDEVEGKGNYLFFLTADHGAAHNPQFLIDSGMNAGFMPNTIKNDLNAALNAKFGISPVSQFFNYQVYLNDSIIGGAHAEREKIKDAVKDWFSKKAEISFIADMEHPERNSIPEPIKTMIVNGYSRTRSGCIQVIPAPGWYEGYATTGTTHGTWNPYDTHIPLLWYGWNAPKGETHRQVNMTDISATLAAMLHIQMPNGCVGVPITEITE